MWEPFTNVKELEALDQYFALMGVTWWQSLACKPMIDTQVNPHTHTRMQWSGVKE
jgi:hypothetical protein